MERTPEPELMDDAAQAYAYATADFSEPHDAFVRLLRERFADLHPRHILDLGCGPGDVARRLAGAFPQTRILGIDGARAMLDAARFVSGPAESADRIELRLAHLPGAALPAEPWDAVVSNSLLHHLRDPATLWNTIAQHAPRTAAIFVMDLLRPPSPAAVHALAERHATDAPEILKRDFTSSLHAAYRPEEIRHQIERAGLGHLQIEVVSDRHLVVWGKREGK